MSWLAWAGAAAGLAVAALVYLGWYVGWEARQTSGMAYFGRPIEERRALKKRIRLYSLPVMPLVRLLALANRSQSKLPSFEFEGVPGPPKVSSADVFARAKQYRPRKGDVFVATQMRCGTTWMQQLVYQIVTRGRGDFDGGRGHLYAVSPWIDALHTVSMDDAPLVGEPPTRIIKTHLPTALTPYSDDAKYIYVTRHPVSCFASIVDYNRTLLGPFMPRLEVFVDWFCSNQMYWLPWPAHVAGWWEWASSRPNVLFIHYEEMKADFSTARDRVAAFLGVALTPDEQRRVTEACTFKFMQAHEEWFEMAPPTMFSAAGRFLPSGAASRQDDVTPETRQRIVAYCREELKSTAYPTERFYPDLVKG